MRYSPTMISICSSVETSGSASPALALWGANAAAWQKAQVASSWTGTGSDCRGALKKTECAEGAAAKGMLYSVPAAAACSRPVPTTINNRVGGSSSLPRRRAIILYEG